MTFKELSANLAQQKLKNVFSFDLKLIAPDIIKDLDDFFDLENGIIDFGSWANYGDFNEKTIEVSCLYIFKRIFKKAQFEVNIVFSNNKDKIEYVISVEPEGSWERFVGGGVIGILQDIGVNLDNAIFYFTSLKTPIELEFDDAGKKFAYEVIPNGVYNIAAHFKIDALETLGIKDNIFQIDPVNKIISKKIRCEISLLDIIRYDAQEIIVKNFKSIIVNGECYVKPFLGAKPIKLVFPIKLDFDSFTLEGKIPDELVLSNLMPGVKIWNSNLIFSGSFSGSYAFGLNGNFGSLSEKNKSEDNTANTFDIQYSNASTGPIPTLFDGYIKQLTFGKTIELMTGISTKIPKFIDDVLSLNDTNIYWCGQPGLTLKKSGMPAPIGFGLFSGFKLLGVDGYTELYYYPEENEVKGLFMVEPFGIPDIIEIGGETQGTPSSYKGPKIKPNGLSFMFKMEGQKFDFEASASITTKFIKSKDVVKASAKFSEDGISFSYKQVLPFAKANIKGAYSHKGDMNLNLKFSVATPKINLDVKPLGKISAQFAVSCNADLIIKNNVPEAMKVSCAFKVMGNKAKFTLSLNINDLENLPELILNAIIEYLEKLFVNLTEWLKGVVQGIIKIADKIKEQAILIAQELKKKIGDNAQKILAELKKAEASCKLAASVLKEGLQKSEEEVAKLLREAEYKAREIFEALDSILDKSAGDILKILKDAEFSYREIGKALSGMSGQLIDYAKRMRLAPKEVCEMLNGMGKSTDEAIKILKGSFDLTNNKEIAYLLDKAKFNTKEIEKAFKDVFHVKIKVKKPSGKIFGKRWSL